MPRQLLKFLQNIDGEMEIKPGKKILRRFGREIARFVDEVTLREVPRLRPILGVGLIVAELRSSLRKRVLESPPRETLQSNFDTHPRVTGG